LDRKFGGASGAAFGLDAPDNSAHIVVSLDYVHRVPPLKSALAEIHRALVPGGHFVFTVPFRVNSEATSSFISHLPLVGGLLPAEFGAEVHEIGWDILESLRKAGFASATAHLYWSEELGYLGPFNFIFSACR
jgi:SAM-dependent methyltransferase